MRVLMLYFTKTGHTLDAIKAVSEGIRENGLETDIVSLNDFNPALLKSCDAFIIGSPCWGGSMGQGVPKPVKKVLESLEVNALAGKLVAGISINGGAGAENTIKGIGKIIEKKGCRNFIQGPTAKAGSPLSLWKGPDIKANDITRFKDFGKSLAFSIKK